MDTDAELTAKRAEVLGRMTGVGMLKETNEVELKKISPHQVSFQWKNPDFLFRNPDLLSGILISY